MRFAALTRGWIIAEVLSLAIGQELLRADDPGDDGWRRTAAGWERVELWAAPKDHEFQGHFQFRPKVSESRSRWDLHPGILALGQLFVVASVFWICRVARRSGRADPTN